MKTKKRISKETLFLIALLAFVFIILILFNKFAVNLLWDETVYLGNARSHITHSNFTEDFRYPLLEYLIAGIWKFTGESILAAKLLVILFSTASVLVLYLISKRFFDWKRSLLLCSLFAVSPLFIYWGIRVYTDVPSMFFILLSFYMLLKAEEAKSGRNKIIWVALAALFLDMAFLMRFTAGLLGLCIAIYFILRKQVKNLFVFALSALIFLTPWFIYNQLRYHNPIWDFKEQYFVVGEWTTWQPISQQIANLFIHNNLAVLILFFVGVVAMFYAILKRKEGFRQNNIRNLDILILIFVVLSFIYHLFFVNMKDARYYISFLPFIFLVAFFGFKYLEEKVKKKKRFVYVAILLFLILAAVFAVTIQIITTQKIYACDINHPIMQSIDYLKDRDPEVVLSNVWPWYGYHLNVKIASLWSENITMLIEVYNASHVTYDDRNGLEFDKKILDQSPYLVPEKAFKGNCAETVYLYKVKI